MISKSFAILVLALFCQAKAQFAATLGGGGGYGSLLDAAANMAGEYGFGLGGQGRPGFQFGLGGRPSGLETALTAASQVARIPSVAVSTAFDTASKISDQVGRIPLNAVSMMMSGRPGYGASGNMGPAGYPQAGYGAQGQYGMSGNVGLGVRPGAGVQGSLGVGAGGRPGLGAQGQYGMSGNLGLGVRPGAGVQGSLGVGAGGRPGLGAQGQYGISGNAGLGARPGAGLEASLGTNARPQGIFGVGETEASVEARPTGTAAEGTQASPALGGHVAVHV